MKILFATVFAFLFVSARATDTITSDLTCMNSNTAPTKASDCTSRTTLSGNDCCLLTGVGDNSNNMLCLSIPSSSLTSELTYYYNGKTYNIDCGSVQTTTTALPTCGPSSAASQKDCATGSSYVNSCCWHTKVSNSTAPSGCYWLGSKYSGNVVWAGIDLDCNASYTSLSMLLIFFSLALLF